VDRPLTLSLLVVYIGNSRIPLLCSATGWLVGWLVFRVVICKHRR
jgi:hypothetical protein